MEVLANYLEQEMPEGHPVLERADADVESPVVPEPDEVVDEPAPAEDKISAWEPQPLDEDTADELRRVYGATGCAACGYEYVYAAGMPLEWDESGGWWDPVIRRFVRQPCVACSPVYHEHLLQYLEGAEEENWEEFTVWQSRQPHHD